MGNDDVDYRGSVPPQTSEAPSGSQIAGLSAGPDESMERFARLVTHLLRVPMAVVSLVEDGHCVLPGLAGVGEPWSSSRQVPLPRTEDSNAPSTGEPPVGDTGRVAQALGAASWTQAPLTDDDGKLLGFLIAIDTTARTWNSREGEALHDLAHVCGAELRLRLLVKKNERARLKARSAYRRSRMLMRMADELAGTTDLTLVQRSVKKLVTTDLRPAHVELLLVEGPCLRRVIDPENPSAAGMVYQECDLDGGRPEAVAVRTGTIVKIPEETALEEFPSEVRTAFAAEGLASAVFLPLPVGHDPVGALVLGWQDPYEVDPVEHALFRSLAEYVARAVRHVTYVADQVRSAQEMQRAMLTEIPSVPGLEIEALYLPAARAQGAMVGGDWYDVYLLPEDARGTLAFTVGDITGHDLSATILMGQVRTMLRQADLDHPDQDPALVLSAFERANAKLGLGASGTLVYARLEETRSGWLLIWTNAGHLGPLLTSVDGAVEQLPEQDLLFHPDLPTMRGLSHQRLLEPGSTLLLFTDGLVEKRGQDMEVAVDRTARLLANGVDTPLPTLLQEITEANAADTSEDDVVLLAIRLAR
ncbi:PP2C family protein-serine/threonine phosphatase [Nocardiopsis kunsanensis]|uniref:PPM-type phosphatase domain-containing protein n=1 Tax=Nocardiopsis kunsanensis TaxID=141693 RepID=A0A918XG23_9ACTN|nr:GAF domain-containing SpoIIE family protein phosphatase [Nocardiopsis kunsanensis]GHD30097.1 hypothetical protein GCM10007147_31620 [Nocardiopsis kunsanensis]